MPLAEKVFAEPITLIFLPIWGLGDRYSDSGS
jgi:hypothetical protein